MIHCKDCRYFEETGYLARYDGHCTIIPPPWLYSITKELSDYVKETDGCDLGQPKADYLNPGSPTGSQSS